MIANKYTKESFMILYQQGLNDTKIANVLGVTSKTIQSFRTKLKLPVITFNYEPTDFQKSVLIGTLLGDGHLRKNKDCSNVSGSIGHGKTQELYSKYKYYILKELCQSEPKLYKNKVADKRNGVFYEMWSIYFRSNSSLNWFYQNLYKEGKKIITKEILKDFNEISLAFLFMDDGYKASSGGYYIATMCFEKEHIQLLVNRLLEFNIQCSVDKYSRIYISAKSQQVFNSLIGKYLIPSMMYKLHNFTVLNKQEELLETPTLERQKEDNQQPSLESNFFEGSTTNSRIQTSNVEDSNADTSILPIKVTASILGTKVSYIPEL